MTRGQIISGLGVVTIGFGIGFLLAGPRQEPSDKASPSTAVTAISERSKAGIPPEFQHILAGTSPSEQYLLATTLRDIRDPRRIRELLDQVHHISLASGVARCVLLRNWLEIDPTAAAAWAGEHSRRNLPLLLKTWVGIDPEGARSAFDHAPPAVARPLAEAVVEQLSLEDPSGALAFLRPAILKLRVGDFIDADAMRHILDGVGQDALLELADSIPGYARNGFRGGVATAMASADAPAAIEWWRHQADKAELLSQIFNNPDPSTWRTAIDWIVDHPRHGGELYSLVHSWGSRDREATQAMLAEILTRKTYQNIGENAFRSGLQSWLHADREAALAWVERATNPQVAKAAASAIADIEERQNRRPLTTAAEVIANADEVSYRTYLSLAPEEREKLPDHLASLPPADATHLLQRLTRHGNHIPSNDIQRLLSVVPITAENTTELTQILSSAMSGASYSPSETAEWATSFPAGVLRNTAVERVARSWNYYDPTGALNWAESLTDPSARAAALTALPRSASP